MPLYEYECDACGHRFERIQKFSDPLVTECPRCGGAVRKLLSSPAIQFKGSGWYITDYARAGESKDKTEKPVATSEVGTTGTTGTSGTPGTSGTTGTAGSSDTKATSSSATTSESSNKAKSKPAKETS